MLNNVKFLKQFISKDETRYHLMGLQLSADFVFAVDGYRGARIPRSYFPEYSHLPATAIIDPLTGGLIEGEPVNFEMFWPNLEAYSKSVILDLHPLVFMARGHKAVKIGLTHEGCAVLHPSKDDIGIDARYLVPFKDGEWQTRMSGNLKPVYFKQDVIECVVMPMRV